ncbi:hypothetical protein V5799_000257 [Amblyomma americanum]|uniref:Uncharacterized protein n=1 Tax=Amblyomma americanum TaxID=6943 RepID=A0AAQ4D3K0_AMBAM
MVIMGLQGACKMRKRSDIHAHQRCSLLLVSEVSCGCATSSHHAQPVCSAGVADYYCSEDNPLARSEVYLLMFSMSCRSPLLPIVDCLWPRHCYLPALLTAL